MPRKAEKPVPESRQAPRGRGAAKPKAEKSPAILKEVRHLALAAGGVLLFVAVYIQGAAGPVGDFIRNFSVGLFGFGAFILPVALLVWAVFGMISRNIRLPIIQSALLLWFVLALLHTTSYLVTSMEGVNLSAFRFLREVYSEGRIVGGGIIGALLGQMLRFFLRDVGAIIVLIAAIIIMLVLVTGRSFVNFVGKGVDKARDYYDERAARRHEERQYEDKEPPTVYNSRRGSKTDNIINIAANEESAAPAKILLVQEEMEERNQNLPKNPLFARRVKKARVNPEVLTFPDKFIYEEDAAEEFYEDIPEEEAQAPPHIVRSLISEPVLSSAMSEPDEDDFEDEYEYSAPIVKGLVDGPPPPQIKLSPRKLDPLFADMDEDEILMYDEFAHASGMKTEQNGPDRPSYENYEMPPINLLTKNDRANASAESRTQVLENSRILEDTLRSFRVEARVVEVSVGPTVTRYDLSPGPGVKVSSIANLSNDLALSLAAQGIRIEAPIPGKSAVGIEIPNKEPQNVFLREILEDERFINYPSKLAFAVGKDIAGAPVVTDVARMPHLLIAGATGSGKSVCINTLIASLLYKARPDEVKLLMIDPKVVELNVYNGIPHLLIPVVTEPKKASGALNWAVQEMENRYNLFAETACRDLKGYNKYIADEDGHELPQIVIIIDELADLMMACKGEVEEAICRLAQKARAAGIHLIVATQRPSVDVITGLIKANIPSRLAFAVSSGIDSRTVLDMYGAEKLLGKGDMLFLPLGQNKPIRVQGGFISDKEVEGLVNFLKAQAPAEYTTEMIQKVTMPGKTVPEGEVDEFFHEAVDFLLSKGKASTSMLQRQFRIGYNRASRLMDDLEARGIVGPEDGVKPRKVTITREEYRELYG